MTSRNASLAGACAAPFYDASMFSTSGGFIGGRFCAPTGDAVCCLPCPASQWVYPDSFNAIDTAAGWVNVVGLVSLLFMLISYIVLPVQHTRSHYLSVCLIVAVMMINLGFVVPLGADPDQCFDEITPNDQYSSLTCAWSGAFIAAGGLSATSWVLIRAFSMHLQICWDIVPGRKFFYWAQFLGWATPAALFTATMSVTGVSFRFGQACHVNHDNSMADFWGWLIAASGIAIILQVATVGYCLHVYLRNLMDDGDSVDTEGSGEQRGQYQGSVRTQTTRAVFSRLKRVLYLQWRGMVIVTNLLFDVIFFTIVFVYLDDYSTNAEKNLVRAEPWLTCLVTNGGDKNKCFSLGEKWLVSENVLAAVLFILSFAGFEVFLLLFRGSIITGWREFFATRFFSHRHSHKQEFVSLDAVEAANRDPASRPWSPRSASSPITVDASIKSPMTMYEMQRRHPTVNTLVHQQQRQKEYGTASVEEISIHSPKEAYHSPLQYGRTTPERDYFTTSTANNNNKNPRRTPSTGTRTVQGMGWDPVSSYASGGGGNVNQDNGARMSVADREIEALYRARGNVVYR